MVIVFFNISGVLIFKMEKHFVVSKPLFENSLCFVMYRRSGLFFYNHSISVFFIPLLSTAMIFVPKHLHYLQPSPSLVVSLMCVSDLY